MTTRRLNSDNINPHVKAAHYAVRGELAIKSETYRAKIANGDTSRLPFSKIVPANVGNPQQVGQKPITFFRQVLSLLENPLLLERENVLCDHLGYKSDVIARAKSLLKIVGSVGAYSPSNGHLAIRQEVAEFLERRDGFPAEASDIYMCAGASSGVNALLHIICADEKSGVLIPMPQYPLYTATLSVLGATSVPYYLNECENWRVDMSAIKEAHETAKAAGTDVRAIVVINPGNPTGTVLSEQDINAIIEYTREQRLVIIADEVYQTNIFVNKFHSFKKVLCQMQAKTLDRFAHVELASLHSVSKGMIGECGHRGGYFELVGFDPRVQAEIYKFVSIMLCAPIIGQCLVSLMVNPRQEGDPSYALYRGEYAGILTSMRSRAQAVHGIFAEMDGVQCGEPEGSMYLFPSIRLPPKAVHAAAAADGRTPDEFYSLKLLDATGVCVVPGSGFGQKEGSSHFRITFLVPGTEWTNRIVEFHRQFMQEYQ